MALALTERSRQRTSAQALVEFALGFTVLLCFLVGLAWLGQVTLHKTESERISSLSFAGGMKNMSTAEQIDLFEAVLTVPQERVALNDKIKKDETKDNINAETLNIPAPIKKIFNFIMGSHREEINIAVPRFMPQVLEKFGINENPELTASITWDQGSYAGSPGLRAFWWTAALLKAGVSRSELGSKLGKLGEYGKSEGGKTIPTNLPDIQGAPGKGGSLLPQANGSFAQIAGNDLGQTQSRGASILLPDSVSAITEQAMSQFPGGIDDISGSLPIPKNPLEQYAAELPGADQLPQRLDGLKGLGLENNLPTSFDSEHLNHLREVISDALRQTNSQD